MTGSANAGGAKRSTRRKWLWGCLLTLAVCVLGLGIAVWIILSVPSAWEREILVDCSGPLSDSERRIFKVLLFPRRNEYQLRGSSELARAVLTTLIENSQDSQELLSDGETPRVEIGRNLLTAVPPPGIWQAYVEALNREFLVVKSDWRHVRFEIASKEGLSLASLELKTKRGAVWIFRYRIDDALNVTPINYSLFK